MEDITMNQLLNTFSENVNKLSGMDLDDNIQNEMVTTFKSSIKEIYDLSKRQEISNNFKFSNKVNKVPKFLMVNLFDHEQIWQQIEFQNEEIISSSLANFRNLELIKKKLIFKFLKNKIKDTNKQEREQECLEDSKASAKLADCNILSLGSSYNNQAKRNQNNKSESDNSNNSCEEPSSEEDEEKVSTMKDQFFKIQEMEDFVENDGMPKSNGNESESDDDESIDLFEEVDDDSGEEAKTAKFKDYFVAKDETHTNKKKNKLMQELETQEKDDEHTERFDEQMSTLELRQKRLQKKIEDLEDKAISEKPWQLKGEIAAENRPQNSLLEQIVDFDLTFRPAPIITEQTSLQLEDIIKKRIMHKLFDSVEQKSRPVETPIEYKKKLQLDQEKSKDSLAKIYEKEYMEKQAALNKGEIDQLDEELQSHKEVKRIMKHLFGKLDALSNFHFTTISAVPELKIVSNIPAIHMEEVAPVAYTDTALLAPQEIREQTKGDIIGKSEKTGTDIKRDRRKKKIKQKLHAKLKSNVKINKSVKKN